MLYLQLSLLVVTLLLLSTGTTSLAAKSKKPASGRATGGGFGAKPTILLPTPDATETTTQLLKFLKAQKATGIDNVEIGLDPVSGIRGLFAQKNFKQGQMLCRIPSDCALAVSDPAKKGDDTPTVAHGGANFLNMYMKPSNARKLWAPYLDTLPQIGSAQFHPTPDFFSDEELELLEFPRLIRQAKDRKEEVQKVAVDMNLTPEELQFATWIVASRAFTISVSSPEDESAEEPNYDEKGQVITKAGEKKSIRVLVPFIDMANHNSDNPNAKLTIIDPEKDDAWFALEATRPISAGKEITIAYGSGIDSSVELLLNYGFVPKSNKIDEFMLKKGGDDTITNLQGWTTSIDEDKAMLDMIGTTEEDACLRKILNFRIRLKESYVDE
jgi:hypothetical protein